MTRIWRCALSQITPLKSWLLARLSSTHLLWWRWKVLRAARNPATCPPTGPRGMSCTVVPGTRALESWRARTLRVLPVLSVSQGCPCTSGQIQNPQSKAKPGN
ncbi:hypothetical protein IHE44_0010211, partial [Lamprotornis superbus]